MDEENFEGTLLLETLAKVGKVEAFFDAVDSDDFEKVRRIMRQAGVGSETIQIVMKMMSDTDGNH